MSLVIPGLTNDTAYDVRVRATNDVGDSDPSNVETVTSATQTAPAHAGNPGRAGAGGGARADCRVVVRAGQ